MQEPRIEVRRADDRFETLMPADDGGVAAVRTRHSFSFGDHYDPANVGFGALVALNDETVRAGAGYPEHPHRDVEIVSWVLSGTLRHSDSSGSGGMVSAGAVQRLSAGSGVTHAEGASRDEPVHFVQTWVRPDQPGTPPSYDVAAVDEQALAAGWVAVASGADPAAAVDLRSRGTTLWVTRLAAGEERTLPECPSAYVFLARGSADVDTVGPLDEGDALRLTVPAPLSLRAREPAELLVWELA